MEKTIKDLVFLDTETTGLDNEDRLCQVAYKTSNKIIVNELFKPPLPIKIGAMAIHHITNKMVEDKPVFIDSKVHKDMINLFTSDFTVLIAHNAKYDVGMLKKEGMEIKNIICTLKLARYLDNNVVIESYSLQYLRYLLELEVEATAHDALGDILVLEKLFERLVIKMQKRKKDSLISIDDVIDEMIKISSVPILIRKFPFGKYKGKKLEDIVQTDRGYLEWLHGQKINEEEKDEDWIYTLKYYLKLPI